MTRVLRLPEIEAAIANFDLITAIEQSFRAYSEGRAIVPPVGELLFERPPGDAHIKYGYLRGDDIFVVKVATGFYENAAKGLPPNAGLVLVFDSTNGLPRAVLLDEGHLTNLRTAAAGAVAAKLLARNEIETVAVLGAGMQAFMQVEMLSKVRRFATVRVWARRAESADHLANRLAQAGFTARTASSAHEAASAADIIITATPASSPLIDVDDVREGVHITAMGSDTPEKQELSAALIGAASLVVADSKSQCADRGEIHHALAAGTIMLDRVVELGNVISGSAAARLRDSDITIADLTGVAVQDIAIAKAVLAATGS